MDLDKEKLMQDVNEVYKKILKKYTWLLNKELSKEPGMLSVPVLHLMASWNLGASMYIAKSVGMSDQLIEAMLKDQIQNSFKIMEEFQKEGSLSSVFH